MSATTVPTATSPAPLWRRFACMVYDVFPLIGLWILAAGLWVLAFHRAYDLGHPGFVLRALLDLWLLVVTGAYFVVSWRRIGQTIGMRAWRVKVLREDGNRLGWRDAALRFVLALVSLVMVGCGFWYAWLDPRRRTWHDRVCGTRVTRV